MLTGCAPQSAAKSDRQTRLHATQQRLNIPEHAHWRGLADTHVDFEYLRLFTSEPTAPLEIIIRVTGTTDTIGKLTSHTITWVTNPGQPAPRYAEVAVIMRGRASDGSGDADEADDPQVVERGYWPIDMDDDGTDDLLILAWHETESQGQGRMSEQDARGARWTPATAGEPMHLRLVRRGARGAESLAITLNTTAEWPEVRANPQRFIPLLEKALLHADDFVWQHRIEAAIGMLASQSSDTPRPAAN